MEYIRQLFSSLRTRLTLTYTLVTMAALLSLLVVLLSGLFTLLSISGIHRIAYLSDIKLVLGWRVTDYLAAGDVPGLQEWMERRYASGLASEPPLDIFDSPAAPFAGEFYVLDAEGEVVAQAGERDAIGQPITLPRSVEPNWFEKQRTTLFGDPLAQYRTLPDGNWFVVLPLPDNNELLGTLVVLVEPAPSFMQSYLPLFGALVGIAAIVLLIGVAPFGALFGYIMARNLSKRLAQLELAADAWSRGEFHVAPADKSTDEIGRLAARLKQMAQQIDILLQSRQELALLEERNRLARELHDTVKQQNFATLMQVRAAKNLARQQRDAQVALEHLESAESLLKQSQQDLKSVIEELRPSQLDGHGLPTAIRQVAQSWSRQNDIAIDFSVEGERPLPLSIEQALYRVAQEALANIARHSGASLVQLRLDYKAKSVSLSIADNGEGFKPEVVPSGFGLVTMRQRITEAHGTLNIESKEGQGTTVTARIDI